MAIGEEIGSAPSTQAITTGHPAYIGVATQYIRPRQTAYVREALQTVIRDVIDAEDLDLEVDPSVVSTHYTNSYD
jgi:Ras GTPase-activating-like protein IQGAP2/3